MFILAVVLLGLALLYFLVTTTVDLFPFNNVRAASRDERRAEVAINGPILALPIALVILGFVMQLPLLAYIGGTIELIVAASGVALWWLPYLFGITVPWATAGTKESWSELHARTYAHTLMVLPTIGNRPRPNLEHIILHSLLIAGGVGAIIAGVTM